MKILVVCQHYWPEPFLITDVCESLVRCGHHVQVLTGVPNYPRGRVYKGYEKRKRRTEERNGVRIARTLTVARRKGILFRLLNYYSFALSSKHRARRLREEFDVVLAYQLSPVMMAQAALTYAKKWGKRCVLYCLDLWPASLSAGGVREGSFIYRYFEGVSKKVYRQADTIFVSSRMFTDYLQKRFGIARERIAYMPQYADACFDAVSTMPPVPKDTVDLVLAGNVGAAQDIPTLLHAAKLLQDRAELRWHVVGDGSELESAKKLSRELGISNVIFHGRHPVQEMLRYYAMADAMLLTLSADPVLGLTLPARMHSYLAAGQPVLAAANGEVSCVIDAAACGFCSEAGDASAFAAAIRRFLALEDRAALGARARAYYETHFTKERFLDTLERALSAHTNEQ